MLSLFLHPDHELILLLINTLQRDLKSNNAIEVCMALDVVSSIIKTTVINTLLPDLENLISHAVPIVRRKTLLVFKGIFHHSPNFNSVSLKVLKRTLGDGDVGVMHASILLFSQIVVTNAEKCSGIMNALIHIVHQILDGNGGSGVGLVWAPWTLNSILSIFSYFNTEKEYGCVM